MKVGYFKIRPSLKPRPQFRALPRRAQVLLLPSAGILTAVLFVNLLWFAQSAPAVSPWPNLPASPSFLDSLFERGLEQGNFVWSFSQDALFYLKQNWLNFLTGSPQSSSRPKNFLTEEEREQIKQEIKNDLERELLNQRQNLLVWPSSGSSSQDVLIRQRLENVFSDPVSISFDPQDTTGRIRPIIKAGQIENDYLFILNRLNP